MKEENLGISETFIARQSIVDEFMDIFGYEFFFREGLYPYARIKEPNEATVKLIEIMLNRIGVSSLIGEHYAFINITKNFLQMELMEVLSYDRFIFELEIKEEESIEELKKILEYFHSYGFKFAIDNVNLNFDIDVLLPYVEYIKVDFKKEKNHNLIMNFIDKIKQRYNIKFIATKLEDKKDFILAKSMGFNLYQGFFISYPELISKRSISHNKTVLLRIFSALSQEKDVKEIEELFKYSPDLSIKLLKYINSSFFGFKQEISSIRKAISLLGYKKLKIWILLLLFKSDENVYPKYIFERALFRGKFVEIILKRLGEDDLSEEGFIVGILSFAEYINNFSKIRDTPYLREPCITTIVGCPSAHFLCIVFLFQKFGTLQKKVNFDISVPDLYFSPFL